MGKWSRIFVISLLVVLGYWALGHYGYSFPENNLFWKVVRIVFEWITVISLLLVLISLFYLLFLISKSKNHKRGRIL